MSLVCLEKFFSSFKVQLLWYHFEGLFHYIFLCPSGNRLVPSLCSLSIVAIFTVFHCLEIACCLCDTPFEYELPGPGIRSWSSLPSMCAPCSINVYWLSYFTQHMKSIWYKKYKGQIKENEKKNNNWQTKIVIRKKTQSLPKT